MNGRGLDLDFARTRPRRPAWAWLLLLAGVAAAAWVGQSYDRATRAKAEAQARVDRLERARPVQARALARDRKDDASRTAQVTAARQLETPWGELFATLQATRPANIGLLGLDADGRRGQLNLTAEAKDYPAMIDYYRRLQTTAGLADITLTQHDVMEDRNAEPVRFVLRGRWGGGGRGGE